jgi:hypothetical protein
MALTCELAVRWRLEATGVHRRKGWQLGGLRSKAAGSEHGEMALLTLEKAPFSAIFRPVLADFRRVFSRAFPSGRKWARMRLPKALVAHGPKWVGAKRILRPS